MRSAKQTDVPCMVELPATADEALMVAEIFLRLLAGRKLADKSAMLRADGVDQSLIDAGEKAFWHWWERKVLPGQLAAVQAAMLLAATAPAETVH